MKLTRIAFVVASLAASSLATAAGQTSANFIMKADALNNGVGDMASANFRLSSSLGDSVGTSTITSVSFKLANGFRANVNVPPAVLNLLTVVSRKFHGGVPFSIDINKATLLTGTVSVEPRSPGGAGHTLVFSFDGNVNSLTAVSALDQAMASAATATFSIAPASPDVVVTLANVADNKRLTVTLTGVNGVSDFTTSVGFLVGDVTQNRAVNAADIAAIKSNLSQPVNSVTRAKFDLNADGSITAADVSAAKARTGLVMP